MLLHTGRHEDNPSSVLGFGSVSLSCARRQGMPGSPTVTVKSAGRSTSAAWPAQSTPQDPRCSGACSRQPPMRQAHAISGHVKQQQIEAAYQHGLANPNPCRYRTKGAACVQVNATAGHSSAECHMSQYESTAAVCRLESSSYASCRPKSVLKPQQTQMRTQRGNIVHEPPHLAEQDSFSKAKLACCVLGRHCAQVGG